ncbi:MAG: GerMN domain-containing protein [Actinomycetota bacterium]|nr:GerMN domain-containing protein [Actinomycetota bacterium]
MTRVRMITAVLAMFGLLGACGISSDSEPRDIAPADQLPLGIGTDTGAGAATGTAKVYLLGPEVLGQATTLQAVARDVNETPTQLLTALFAGPNSGELDQQLRTALPTGLSLLSTQVRAGVLVIDVSKDLQQLSGQALISAVAQIVFTCAELSIARPVKILVEGADQQWPRGNGEVQSEPLTVYDYPGLVQSAQPRYPAIPTPSQP